MKSVLYKVPQNLLGRSVRVYMKEGGSFYFKVTGAGEGYVTGFDDEGVNLRIEMEDIEVVLG